MLHTEDEMDNKWHACKLTTDEYGKVRWCFGSPRTWSNKLKVLIFLPIVLLIIVLIYLLTKPVNNATALNKANNTTIRDQKPDAVNQTGKLSLSYKYSYFDLEVNGAFVDESVSLGSLFIKRIYDSLNNKTIKPWDKGLTAQDIRKYQGENMLKYMNDSVDPCDDFYEYACGNWATHHPNPTHHSSFDMFELVRENVDYHLRELLERTADDTEINATRYDFRGATAYFEKILLEQEDTVISDPILKTRQMYNSCMNLEAIESRGVQPLLDVLGELRYWPIIQKEWNESDFDLIWLLAQLRLYNNDILIGEWVAPDMNSEEYVIMLKQSSLGLPRKDYYLDEESEKYILAYQDFMLEVVSILGANITDAKKDVEAIISFETELARTIPNNDCQTYTVKTYIHGTLEEFQKLIPQIDWIKYFEIILEKNAKRCSLNMTIITYCLDYLRDLVILIEKTSHRTLTNYVLWRFVTNRINNLDDRFNLAKQKFHDALYGREVLPPRWRVCIGQTNSHLSFALGHLFVKNYFDEKSKNDTIILAKALQIAYSNVINSTEWLTDISKRMAVDKIESMQLKIGYPDQILDVETLTLQYHDILIHPDYYFENCLSLLQHTFRKGHWKLGEKVNKNIWNTAPTVVNAYYIRHKNQIRFPAAILQPPFYHQYFPNAINFGGLGVTIGHEISHAFDNKGRFFDNEGKIRLWLTKNDTEKLDKISNCLTDQYNHFTLPELNVNLDGFTTQPENIADNSAIKPAYNAYLKWLQNNEDVDLPQVNVSNIQLFFISYAQVLCGNTRQEVIKRRTKVSVHPPGKFRVLGTLRNFPEFSEAFRCEEGSPMNPKEKCVIW